MFVNTTWMHAAVINRRRPTDDDEAYYWIAELYRLHNKGK